jgi:fatty acid desaturase
MKVDLPRVAYPALLMFLVCFLGFFSNFYFVQEGYYNSTIGFVLAVIYLYYVFTPIHESSHGNIFYGKGRGPLNAIIGSLSGMMLLAPYPIFKLLHLRHHSFVNNPQKDPDSWVKGSNNLSILLRCLTLFFYYYFVFLREPRSLKAKLNSLILYNLCFFLVGWTVVQYFTSALFLTLWIYPLVVASGMLGLLFDYIPHYPHDDSSRYNNSRTIISSWLDIIMVGQNYHIIHHLYPRIPFHMYKSSYHEMPPEEKSLHHREVQRKTAS